MLKELVKETVLGYLGPLKGNYGVWQSRNCPLCIHRGHSHDTRGRFGVKITPEGIIATHCFNCSFKTKYVPGNTFSKDFIWFLSIIGVPDVDIHKLKFQAYREKEAGEIFSAPKLVGNKTGNWTEIELPEGAMPFHYWDGIGCQDRNYLISREYAENRLLDLNDLYWSPDKHKMMYSRFILPFYYREKIVGYTGRYNADSPFKTIPRYINKTPECFVYNLDKQTNDKKFTILCEGVLDAYLTDGVSCLGTINDDQIAIINGLGKDIIVCPDRDTPGDRLVEVAIEQGWEVTFPKWGRGVKDAANASQKFGRLLTLRSIIDGAIGNPLQIRVNRRMDKV